jgi:hypothetical protein
MAVSFLIVGCLALWVHNFISNLVKDELTAQKIYFPEKGSSVLDPATYPDLQQYAGQLVDTPAKAKAYANGFIGRHLKKIANGKVYAEVSTQVMKDPTSQKLQQQKQALFQGETLRGMLLMGGYGFGTIGKIAGVVAYTALASGSIMLVAALFLVLGRVN